MRPFLLAAALVALAAPAAEAKWAQPKWPERHHPPGCSYVVPKGWTLKGLPVLGKPPRETRRWELSRPAKNGRATIELEIDRSERPGRFPVAAAKAQARQVAATFGFTAYSLVDLKLKGMPGFYERWDANLPGRAPFRIVAATVFRQGRRYGLTAQVPLGASAEPVEHELRGLMRTWRWEPIVEKK